MKVVGVASGLAELAEDQVLADTGLDVAARPHVLVQEKVRIKVPPPAVFVRPSKPDLVGVEGHLPFQNNSKVAAQPWLPEVLGHPTDTVGVLRRTNQRGRARA